MVVHPRDVVTKLAEAGQEASGVVHQVASALDDAASGVAASARSGVDAILPGRHRRRSLPWNWLVLAVIVAVVVWAWAVARRSADEGGTSPSVGPNPGATAERTDVPAGTR